MQQVQRLLGRKTQKKQLLTAMQERLPQLRWATVTVAMRLVAAALVATRTADRDRTME